VNRRGFLHRVLGAVVAAAVPVDTAWGTVQVENLPLIIPPVDTSGLVYRCGAHRSALMAGNRSGKTLMQSDALMDTLWMPDKEWKEVWHNAD
jgi:hypothetical protein